MRLVLDRELDSRRMPLVEDLDSGQRSAPVSEVLQSAVEIDVIPAPGTRKRLVPTSYLVEPPAHERRRVERLGVVAFLERCALVRSVVRLALTDHALLPLLVLARRDELCYRVSEEYHLRLGGDQVLVLCVT